MLTRLKLASLSTIQGPRVHPCLFKLKNTKTDCLIEVVNSSDQIDRDAASKVLVDSFIGEYKKYLQPNEIDLYLDDWDQGENSVQKYYEKYFKEEHQEFEDGHIDYWVTASVNGKLVGWATFKIEDNKPNAVYMNLLVVDPAYQKMGIGEQLVMSLINMQVISDLRAIHLLIRKKNKGGRIFYEKLGFNLDLNYKRENFVDVSLLEGLSWENPVLKKTNTKKSDRNLKPIMELRQYNELLKENQKMHFFGVDKDLPNIEQFQTKMKQKK